MKPQCETTAECLRELARVMDQFRIKSPIVAVKSKYVLEGCVRWVDDEFPLFSIPKNWQFAIAVVEGKPVFTGDELFNEDGTISIVTKHMPLLGLSWNPPKPKTIMVEMSVEDAIQFAKARYISPVNTRLTTNCKKALENNK